MHNKKSDKSSKSPELTALERRVDVMMSVEPLPDETPSVVAPPPDKPDKPVKPVKPAADEPEPVPVEIQPTAPPLPPKLLKTIGADKPAGPAKTEAPKPHRPAKIAAAPALTESQPVASQSAEPTPSEPPSPPAIDNDITEDRATDKAVDDIVAHEADTQLAVEDAVARRRTAQAGAPGGHSLLAAFFTSPWTWLVIIGTVSVLYLWYR